MRYYTDYHSHIYNPPVLDFIYRYGEWDAWIAVLSQGCVCVASCGVQNSEYRMVHAVSDRRLSTEPGVVPRSRGGFFIRALWFDARRWWSGWFGMG